MEEVPFLVELCVFKVLKEQKALGVEEKMKKG
jgi:hypothetical protein